MQFWPVAVATHFLNDFQNGYLSTADVCTALATVQAHTHANLHGFKASFSSHLVCTDTCVLMCKLK